MFKIWSVSLSYCLSSSSTGLTHSDLDHEQWSACSDESDRELYCEYTAPATHAVHTFRWCWIITVCVKKMSQCFLNPAEFPPQRNVGKTVFQVLALICRWWAKRNDSKTEQDGWERETVNPGWLLWLLSVKVLSGDIELTALLVCTVSQKDDLKSGERPRCSGWLMELF